MAEWPHRASDNAAVYHLKIKTPEKAGLECDEQLSQLLGVPDRPHELYRVGGWMAESFRRGPVLEVRLRCEPSSGEKLRISFEAGTAEQVTVTLPEPQQESKTWTRVNWVEIEPGRMIRVEEAERSAAGPEGNPAFRPVGTQRQNPEPYLAQNTAQAQELENLRRTLASVRSELDAERRFNTRMQAMLEAPTADVVADLERQLEQFGLSLQELFERKRRSQEQLDEAAAQQETQQAELDRLQRDLETARNRAEVLSLDCEQARTELTSLQFRFSDDSQSLQLMAEEPFLNGKSLQQMMEDIQRSLDVAEDRLGAIVAIREKINATVQKAILRDDGFLPVSVESGGEEHGSSAAEGTNPGTGTPDSETGAEP